jgi:transposase
MSGIDIKDKIKSMDSIDEIADVAAQTVDALNDENEKLASEKAQLEAKVKWYEEQMRLAAKQKYASKSEVVSKDQMTLFNEVEHEQNINREEPTLEEITYKRRKKKATQEELFKNLEVETKEYKLDDCTCPTCSSSLHEMSKRVTKEVKIIPAKAVVVEHVGYVYSCRHCETTGTEATIVNAPMPSRLLKGSVASSSSVAHIMNQKYNRHQPLYRLEQEFKSMDIKLSRQTMSNWVIKTADVWLKPIYEYMHQELLKEDIIHADETTLDVIKVDSKKQKGAKKTYMWLYMSGQYGKQMALYDHQISRGYEHPKRFLKGYSGYLMTDGYQAYDKLDVTPVRCLAHIRRKYKETLDALPKGTVKEETNAYQGLMYCNQLYSVEHQITEESIEKRYKIRNDKAKPILDDFLTWANNLKPQTMPKSKLGKAINYTIEQFKYLENYLKDGRLDIDNNRGERAIKPFVLGRKNWMFSNTKNGADTSALVYSIVESAKMNNLKVFEYLNYLFENLPNEDKLSNLTLSRYVPWSDALPEYLKLKTDESN